MNDIFASDKFAVLLESLQQRPCADAIDAWPQQQLAAMADAGVMQWDVPLAWGGVDLSANRMLEGLRILSSACLVSTFVLTQRSAAVRRIATSSNEAAKHKLLPRLLTGEIFATVGISHLTTSGQHLKTPLVQVVETQQGFELSGTVPWATSATKADFLITGGTLNDGRQILAAIPAEQEGVKVLSPVHLMALNASQTGAVQLDCVQVTHEDMLHGPVNAVMQQGTGGGAGSLGTSALAIGATNGTLRQLDLEAKNRTDIGQFLTPLQCECDQLNADLQLAATGTHPDGHKAAEHLRRKANSLVMRAAQTWLAVTKGAGYVHGHPAERAVRESMFFLVWSCPQPVLDGNLHEFACSSNSQLALET